MAGALSGQVAVVTGGARGIGAACATALSREGAAIVVLDRLAAESEVVTKAIIMRGGRAASLAVDLTEANDIPGVVARCEKTFGRVDILVNNAGISSEVTTESITVEQWDAAMAVNLRAAFFVTQSILPMMIRQGGGAIVNMGSIVARSGGINSTVDYTASKAGVIGMTRTLARQYGSKGIRVNAVAPGPILTEMIQRWPRERLSDLVNRIPLGRLGTPEDVADVVVFLASPMARYLTGVTIDVAGGLYMS